jgi:ubiquitin thioesterase protein OTUB1
MVIEKIFFVNHASKNMNDEEQYTYDDFTRQQSLIEQEQLANPLLDIKQPLNVLKQLYNQESENVQQKINKLQQHYSHIRIVRGDGNCFYRALLYGMLEKIILEKDTTRLQQLVNVVDQSLQKLVKLGYPEYTLEDFYDCVLEFFKWIQSELAVTKSQQTLLQDMTDKFMSDDLSQCLICYLRFMISCYLQEHKDDFEPFIFATSNCSSLEEYARHEVEVMGKECDNISMSATSGLFDVCFCVEYLDVSLEQHSIKIPDEPSRAPYVHLLYRPGHYDILYRN